MPDHLNPPTPQTPNVYQSDEEKIMKIVREMAFPRMVGTNGEKEIQGRIYEKFKTKNLQARSENVTFYYIPPRYWVIYNSLFLIFFSFLLLSFVYTLFPLYVIITILILIVQARRNSFFSKKNISMTTKNIIFELNSSKRKEFDAQIAKIIICAHYDSISSQITNKYILLFSGLGIKSIKLSTITLIILMPLNYVHPIGDFSAIIYGLSLIILIYGLVSNSIIALNKKGNNSSGAVDNSSGMAVLFSLLEIFSESLYQLSWCDMVFLFTGAEEWGWAGSKSYLRTHLDELNQYTKVYIINIDSLANQLSYIATTGVCPKKSLNPNLNSMIRHYGNILKIKITPIDSGLFLGGDHMPFHEAGFESCCLCSPLENEIHSSSDVKEKIIPRVLLDTVEIVKNIITNIERNVKNQMEV